MMAFLGMFWLLGCLFVIVVLAAMWKIYAKAGQPGWAAIIPIYNLWVMLKIVGRPWWFLLLMLVPLVNLVIGILLSIDLAKSFGQSVMFAVGLMLLGIVFYPILGFGDAKYVGPAGAASTS